MNLFLNRWICSSGIIFHLICLSAIAQSSQPPSETVSRLLANGIRAESNGNMGQAVKDYAGALRVEPNNVEANLKMGLLKGQTGDFSGAAAEFRKAINANPDSAEAHYNLGVAMVAGSSGSPDWVDATTEFRTAVRLKPDYLEAKNMLGLALIQSGKPKLAIPEFRSALHLDYNLADVHFNLGAALASTGQIDAAYAEYLIAVKLKAKYPEAQIALGNICLEKKDFAAAAAHFRAALLVDPDLEDAHYGFAKALRAQNDKVVSRIQFRQASVLTQRRLDGVRSSHLSNEALDLAKKGDFNAAIDSARQAVLLKPDNALAHFNLGLLLADSGDFASAIRESRKAISLEPFQSVFYFNMSRMQERMDDRQGAIDSMRRALLLDPSNAELEKRLQSLDAKGGSLLREHTAVQTSQTSYPYGAISGTATDHFAFGKQLYGTGDALGAIGEFLRALTLQPTYGQVRYNLALAYERIGEDSQAELELREMLMLCPDSIEGHLALGKLLLKSGDNRDAATEFHSVLAIQAGNRVAKDLLNRSAANLNR